MNDIFDEALWETLVKTAVIQSSYEENSSYPTEKQLENYPIPAQYDRKIQSFIQKLYKKKRRNWGIGRIASMILIILGISFSCLLQFTEVRAACYEVIVQIYEKYIQIDYPMNSSDDIGMIVPQYIPEGFHLSDSYSDQWEIFLEYENEQNEVFKIFHFNEQQSVQLDNEHYFSSQTIINDFSAVFYDAQDSLHHNYLIWHSADGYFHLSSTLEFDDMKKIAENVIFYVE